MIDLWEWTFARNRYLEAESFEHEYSKGRGELQKPVDTRNANLTAPSFYVLLDFPEFSSPLLKYCVVLEAAGFKDF